MSSENDRRDAAALIEMFERLEKKLDSIIALLEEGNDTEEDDSEDEDLAEDDDEDEGGGGKKRTFGSKPVWKQSNGFTHPGTCKRFVPRYNPYSRPRMGNY